MRFLYALVFFYTIPFPVYAEQEKVYRTGIEFAASSAPFPLESTEKWPQTSNQISIIPLEDFYLRGVEFPSSPVKITLRGNEVDMSSLIPALELVKESPYDNFFFLERFVFPKTSEKIRSLCKNSNLPSDCEEKANTELRGTLDRIYQELENEILYPVKYFSIGSERMSGLFQKGMDVLGSDCRGKCDDYGLTGAIRYSSQEEYAQLYDKIKNTDEKCQRNILNTLGKALEGKEFPRRCLEEENKKHPVCESMSKDIDIVRGRVLELAELAYGPGVLKTTEAKAPCLDCVDSAKGENISLNLFSNLIHNFSEGEHSQCSELEPGQEKRIYSGTMLNHCSYNIKKAQDGTYSIPLSLKFSADENYDGDVSKDQVPGDYMKRVQNCLNKANEKMLGSDGEKLKIVVQAPQEESEGNCYNSDTKEIAIGSQEHRSHARKYESDIDCPVITHEILHLLGLCDEYEEKAIGYYTHTQTGEMVGEVQNRFSADEINQKFNFVEGYEFKTKYDCRVTFINGIMSDPDERWDNVFKNGKNDSLLTPRQFNAILYGSCEEKNKGFNKCSQLAYQDSIKNPGCIEKKQQCESQNSMGGSKQEEMGKLNQQIQELLVDKEDFLQIVQAQEEKGALDDDDRKDYNDEFQMINEQISALRKRLKVVESWPDTSK